MKTENQYGIEYFLPKVVLLREGGFGVSEYAARTCYDSFEMSENPELKKFKEMVDNGETPSPQLLDSIEDSALLDKLAWVHHHHSIIEHASLSYLVEGTSRGVLQEHARHRLQNISVRSTRYTMGGVINAFVATMYAPLDSIEEKREFFGQAIEDLDMFVIADQDYVRLEANEIYSKLSYQMKILGEEEFLGLALSKDAREKLYWNSDENFFEILEVLNRAKAKRNVGDPFKHIVTDNWKVDMVITFNLRSLKNYLDLRNSNAAYFQIRWLAQAIMAATPEKYLALISKKHRKTPQD